MARCFFILLSMLTLFPFTSGFAQEQASDCIVTDSNIANQSESELTKFDVAEFGTPITSNNLDQLASVVEITCDWPLDLAWSPNSSYLAISTTEGIWTFNVSNHGSPPRDFPSIAVNPWDGIGSMTFSADSTTLATVNPPDGDLHFWSLIDDEHTIVDIQTQDYTGASAISPDFSIWAIAHNNGDISIWDVQNGKQVALLQGHHRRVGALAFSPDSSRLVSAGGRVGSASINPRDTTLRVWDTTSGDLLKMFELSGLVNMSIDPAQKITFSSDGTTALFTVMSDNGSSPIGFLDINRMIYRTISLEDHDYIKGVVFNPDRSLLAVGARSRGTVFLQGREFTPLMTLPFDKMVLSMAFSPDGALLAIAHELQFPVQGQVEIWSVP